VIEFTAEASRHVADLRQHYESLERSAALRNLDAALDAAVKHITDGKQGLSAPKSYPFLAKPGRAWIKSGRYWVTYLLSQPPIVTGVFYETADIPNRL
jgi:hypothetical protein